jgi:hypothetical protein
MLNYSLSKKTTSEQAAHRAGRRPKNADMTSAQSKAEAARLLTIGLTPEAWRVLDWLSVGGVMSVAQLQLTPRTLRGLAQNRLVDRVPFPTKTLAEAFTQDEIPYRSPDETQLYVLGPVGLEMLKTRHPYPMPTGHLSYTLPRLMHDVILNEIVLRVMTYAESLGWEAQWWGTHTAKLMNDDKQEILEPDALLVLKRAGQERAFCVEYHHHEDKITRAEMKVLKYQKAYTSQLWGKAWDLERFPTVLAVFDQKIVGTGYQEALKASQAEVQVLGKLLKGVVEDNLAEWADFVTNTRVPLLEARGGGINSPAEGGVPQV